MSRYLSPSAVMAHVDLDLQDVAASVATGKPEAG